MAFQDETCLATTSSPPLRCLRIHWYHWSCHINSYYSPRLRSLPSSCCSIHWPLNWSCSTGMCANGCSIDYGKFTINCRPVEEDKHIEPSRLLEYCKQHHFQTPLCHSYRHSVKNLLIQKLQYWKRGPALMLLNMSQNVWVVVAVILVSSLSYSKGGEWLTRTKRSLFRSSMWNMWNPSEKVSFKRWVVLWKDQKYAQLKIDIWSNKKISLPVPSIIAWPDCDVEQSCSCH